MLRALFVLGIIGYGCAKSVRGPFYALLFYLWIAYFRPEFWLWTDFFSQLNLSFIVGLVVLVSTLFSPSEKLRFGFGPTLIILFLLQSTLATVVSPHFDYAFVYYEDFVKISIISLLIVSLVTDERRVRLVFLVIVASVGIEAVKQGWAQLLLNPGAQNANDVMVFGDNNFVAVGMMMITAMMMALARTATTRKERLFTRFAAVGVLYRGISTYSRGGFLSGGALAVHYILRSRRKVVGLVVLGALSGMIVPVLPDVFWARMNTIQKAQENLDEAAEGDRAISGRLHFWAVAWDMAKARPLLGVGHNAYNASYKEFDFSGGKYPGDRSVHNSWLGIMAELGFPGLILFVVLFLYVMWTNRRVMRQAKKHPELANLSHYAQGIEGALVVFAVGGSFVAFQYVEIQWHLIGLSIALNSITRARVAALTTAAVPTARDEAVAMRPWGPGATTLPGPVPASLPGPAPASLPGPAPRPAPAALPRPAPAAASLSTRRPGVRRA
jgi:probable O-glycosylation ligase (exosortase A-associated)